MENVFGGHAQNTMRSNLVKSFISDLTPYLGEYDDLSRFLADVEDIIPPLTKLEPLETLIRFKQITQKLRGKARRILQEKPETWEQVRTLLIRECADRMDIGAQIVAMERIGYQGSIYRTYEKLLHWQIRMIDKIELGTDPVEEKTLLSNSVKRRCYLQLRKSLPQACQGALTSRNCTSLTDAIRILHEEDFLAYDRYHEDRRVPNHPTNNSPMRPFQNHSKDRNNNYHNQNKTQQPSNKPINQNHNDRRNNNGARPHPPNQHQRQWNNRDATGQQPPRRYDHQNHRDPSQQSRFKKQKPWRFNPENFDEPVKYNATGDTEPMEWENFYLKPQLNPEQTE